MVKNIGNCKSYENGSIVTEVDFKEEKDIFEFLQKGK